ncbi:hypothetical protein D9757_004592 [Collybiopsis confluens]|uniref:CCHC-type domain-containing protein n=1 Tax=Collybiopsis confluens TaxID=2823264 RepID=A0A8H5MBN6_9AGAR|nr:hypothetical protein D9757_004592 [Collybiopsis confluens]
MTTPYSHSNFNYSFPSSAPAPSSSSLPDPVPMEVSDAMKPNRPHGPLSEAERTDCLVKGLCLYCGIGGHVKDDCPKRSAQAITRTNAKNSTNLSTPVFGQVIALTFLPFPHHRALALID